MANTETYTLSLHDALPISFSDHKCGLGCSHNFCNPSCGEDSRQRWRLSLLVNRAVLDHESDATQDRKSTRLNSSHITISYAVFCLKKKKIKISTISTAVMS